MFDLTASPSATSAACPTESGTRGTGVPWIVVLGLLILLPSSWAGSASPAWPDEEEWRPLTQENSVYGDPEDDQNPNQTDVVGDIVGGSEYPAGYWDWDETHVYFRMRTDANGEDKNYVWLWPIDVDLDSGTDVDGDGTAGDVDVEWTVQVRQSGGNSVDLAKAEPGSEGPTWDDVAFQDAHDPGNPGWSGDLNTYSRWIYPTGDGSTFRDTEDAFVDAAVPWNEFSGWTGIQQGVPFKLAIASSASHSVVNKDDPNEGFADAVQTPEPGELLLLLLALATAGTRRRRREALR